MSTVLLPQGFETARPLIIHPSVKVVDAAVSNPKSPPHKLEWGEENGSTVKDSAIFSQIRPLGGYAGVEVSGRLIEKRCFFRALLPNRTSEEGGWIVVGRCD